MHNVHDDAPVLLRTRWALSYLRGPLTLAEIARLQADTAAPAHSPAATEDVVSGVETLSSSAGSNPVTISSARPVVPPGLRECFLPSSGARVEYEPRLGAQVRAHFVDARAGVDLWTETYYLASLGAGGPDWQGAEVSRKEALDLRDAPASGAAFAEVPGAVLAAKAQQQAAKALADHVFRTSSVPVLRCPTLKATATPDMAEGEFRARLGQSLRERRDQAVDVLRRKYAARLATLQDRQRRAEQKLAREKDQASNETMSSALSVGGSLLGALFGGGRRSSALGKAAAAARSVGRIGKERTDVTHAESDLTSLREQLATLESELESEVAALEATFDPAAIQVETVVVKARKSDIAVSDLALVWRPA
jgi:hypothetical protein